MALAIRGQEWGVSWAGDSRAYLYRDGRPRKLTRDHKPAAEALEEAPEEADPLALLGGGSADAADAAEAAEAVAAAEAAEITHGGEAAEITRAVGGEESLELDPVSDVIAAGDRFLLCSDGLYAALAQERIVECSAAPVSRGSEPSPHRCRAGRWCARQRHCRHRRRQGRERWTRLRTTLRRPGTVRRQRRKHVCGRPPRRTPPYASRLRALMTLPLRATLEAALTGTVATSTAGLAGAPSFGPGYKLRGRYLLEEMIGQGAMGQVWRAKDLLGEEARDRNPYVAVKVLNSDFEQRPDAFIALHREAMRAQKLAHPNIVTVHVFDRDEASGRAFIAMELLEGQPLDRVIRKAGTRGLAREQALPIIRGMAEGLAYAHRKGIVHSDFKPANVFLTSDGTPKILDFGIARAIQVADAEGIRGAVAGGDGGFEGYTLRYAAPESPHRSGTQHCGGRVRPRHRGVRAGVRLAPVPTHVRARGAGRAARPPAAAPAQAA